MVERGLLPIRRYNTNDMFEVTVKKHHPFKFKPLGRINTLKEGLPSPFRLEELIYSVADPIFNYTVNCASVSQVIDVDLVALSDDRVVNDVRLKLEKEFPGYEVTVRLNVPQDPFIKFAPKPKLNRYKIN